jgi:hypothetical protein
VEIREGSGRAPPSYQWEKFTRLFDDRFEDLTKEHWEEVALDKDRVRLDPDWPAYLELEARGQCKVFTVRVQGRLAGYSIWFVRPHLHYKSTLHGMGDVFYLDPEYRQGPTGYLMFVRALAALKALGVVKVGISEKLHMRHKDTTIGTIFERLGFEAVEMFYTKML